MRRLVLLLVLVEEELAREVLTEVLTEAVLAEEVPMVVLLPTTVVLLRMVVLLPTTVVLLQVVLQLVLQEARTETESLPTLSALRWC